MDKKYLMYLVVFLAGVALASQVRKLPGGNMIPSV